MKLFIIFKERYYIVLAAFAISNSSFMAGWEESPQPTDRLTLVFGHPSEVESGPKSECYLCGRIYNGFCHVADESGPILHHVPSPFATSTSINLKQKQQVKKVKWKGKGSGLLHVCGLFEIHLPV